jgi:hypothetical protein
LTIFPLQSPLISLGESGAKQAKHPLTRSVHISLGAIRRSTGIEVSPLLQLSQTLRGELQDTPLSAL